MQGIEQHSLVIAGGGVAGMALALAAGRQGARVVVVERDPAPVADSPEAAFGATRRGAPQVHQGHGFLARLTLVLRERFPDVLDALVAAGARPLPLTRDLGDPRPGDEDLAILAVRRTTLEWVLRRAVLAEPNVELRGGAAVAGVVAESAAGLGGAGEVPHVTGLRLESGEVLPASTVAACTGRRGDVPRWLGELGVVVPEEEHDTRLVYLTRWYRQLDVDGSGVVPELPPRLGGDLGYLKYLAVPCDGGTFSITLAVRGTDSELRSALADPDRFEQTCRMLAGPGQLFTDSPMEPLGPVLPMGGLVNRLRRFVDAAGAPLVTGFHTVGDAHTCTNPLYGRGCALAFVQATLLTDALVAHPDDPAARVVAYEKGSAREVEPWYQAAVQMDAWRPPREPVGPGEPGRETLTDVFARIVADGGNDPVIGRGILRLFNLLLLPQDLMADGEFLSAVAPIVARPAPATPPPPEGPTREEVLA
ncbi:MAG TPA: FAD-binding protein [Acidimicrobiales bacterium]|nr:FAD-binding protein [Acidimicrobiales bacterium]